MIDLHSHILPGIDDGSKSMEQSLNMITIAKQEGITAMVATHHFLEAHQAQEYISVVSQRINDLRALLKEEQLHMDIIRGAEVYVSPILAEMDLLSEVCIGGGRYMLMELPMADIPQYTDTVIYQLRLKGIVPIIAHPERNHRIMEDPNLIYRLVDLGALGQVNTGSVTGMFGRRVQKCARILLEHNLVHAFGSDAHSDGMRAPRMKEAVRKAQQWIGEEKVYEMTDSLPSAILENREWNLPSPVPYKRRSRLFSWFGR